MAEPAMDAVELEQMCIRLRRCQIVDGNHFDIVPPALDQRPQNVAPDAAKAVYSYLDGHI